MSADIFLSYSQNDSQKVIEVREFLESLGFAIWFDSRTLHGGENWSEEIIRGIKESRLFLLALSGHSNSSRHVKRELTIADEEKKPIIPFLLPPPIEPSGTIRYFLTGLQKLMIDSPDGLNDLAQCIRERLPLSEENIWEASHRLTAEVPEIEIGPFQLREGIRSIIATFEKELPPHLIAILAEEQGNYFLDEKIPEHREDAIRRLRNHGLLAHDGQWLFTPTRSKRIWTTELGNLLLSIVYPNPKYRQIVRFSVEVLESLRAIRKTDRILDILTEIDERRVSAIESTFRVLRNHSLIGYKTLSSKTPLLHELSEDDFYLTDLGRFYLRSMERQERSIA